ncbi:MAG: DNA recombination protein RmuC [Candidatus Cloacimonetes bacterium]|nr:DNA recombination protein RmuC [Candidatus Cloacimonadota bacterium]
MELNQQLLVAIGLQSIVLLIILYKLVFTKNSYENTDEKISTLIKDEFCRNRDESNKNFKENRQELSQSVHQLNEAIITKFEEFLEKQRSNFALFEAKQVENFDRFQLSQKRYFEDLQNQQLDRQKDLKESLRLIKEDIEKQLDKMRIDNQSQLNEMRKTVDEKLETTLEKRLGESFKLVSERLEQVHKGLGEMQTLASGVGDLKKVLSNVKTRGILGEYQLETILEQILTTSQYEKDVKTKKGSGAHVEFAIKLPGQSMNEHIWLPVDAKFPLETYSALQDAYQLGDITQINSLKKDLSKTIESFAKDISGKYIDPPHTTDFAIMFLPIEGLYAEVLREPQLFEKLQRSYGITVAGPTTLSALLNSLQMGFRTLAVQRRSSEVWKVLSTVKTEFVKFSDQLTKVNRQLDTAKSSLDVLQNTRVNVLTRKLKDVEVLEQDSNNLLDSVKDT